MNFGFIPVFRRDMRRYLRFRDQLFISLLHPVLWIALFGFAMAGTFQQALGPGIVQPGIPQIGYLTFMVPGMIAVTILFANMAGGFGILMDKNWGILREIMASPMPRGDLVLGIALSTVVKSLIQTTIIILLGLILGMSFCAGQTPAGMIFSLAGIILFISLFSVAVLCISVYIAMKASSPEGYEGIITVLGMPAFFASNALYPLSGLPPVIRELALFNPLTHLTNGLRFFTLGDHFSAIGFEFVYTGGEILISFIYLAIFALAAFLFARHAVEQAVIT